MPLLMLLLLMLPACRVTPPGQYNAVKLQTDQTGLYRVTPTDLRRVGFAIETLTPAPLLLSHSGQPVPYIIEEGVLFFYSPPVSGRYTRTRTFLLENGLGPLMKTVSPQTTSNSQSLRIRQRYETNALYEARAAPDMENPWFWQRVSPGQNAVLAFDFPHHPVGNAAITILLWGLTHDPDHVPDHSAALFLNDIPLQSITWDGRTRFTQTVPLPLDILRHGPNTLRISSTGSASPIDTFFVDAFIVEVNAEPELKTALTLIGNDATVPEAVWQQRPFLLDVTDPFQPIQLQAPHVPTGTTALLNGRAAIRTPRIAPLQTDPALLTPQRGADLIIVLGDASWQSEVRPLVERRERQGLRVFTVSIDALYDTFNFGVSHPQAITALLQHAGAEWTGAAPQFILLVGDSSIDFAGYANDALENGVPTRFTTVTYGGETVSDALLGELDARPGVDIAIGRWPVKTQREVALLVEKTLAAEAVAFSGDGRVITDPSDPAFTAFAQRAGLHTPSGRQSVPFLTAYVGHGSLQQWGSQNLQTELDMDAASLLLVQFTCLTGLFAHPTQDALSEQILLADSGPTHIIAATSLTLSNHQEPFARALLDALLSDTNRHIGNAFLEALRALDLNRPDQREIHNTFLLFGDPSAPLPNRTGE